MHFLFAPNHVQLLSSCYPPTSALLTSGPDYSPSPHELSRLTYYASNHPGKLAKLGAELEKRVHQEAKKAAAGNLRARSSLLISLAILRALATECRRDIALISASLVASVDLALAATPGDLEVVARIASVFTAWTTYTNGHLIGADHVLTQNYLSILRQFSDLTCSNSSDTETRNRTRLIGFAAITGAISSEALYNDSRQFQAQVLILLKPILVSLFDTDLATLNDQSLAARDTPGSPYLAEFRTRPALERRAASIHLHIDGDKGPSSKEVSDAALRALFSLFDHAGGTQLGYIVQTSFDNMDSINAWIDLDHCCWYAKKMAEWAQYQYRYVVPTRLVEKLLEYQDRPTATTLQLTLASMISAVFTSPTTLVNLSSSDLISNLTALLLRRNTVSSKDPLIPYLIECIASLGCHIYYSDQIQDLAAELINRIIMVEVQSSHPKEESSLPSSRSSAIFHLMAALKDLIRIANEHEGAVSSASVPSSLKSNLPIRMEIQKPDKLTEVPSHRTRVSPELWQDTLSLICDKDPSVRTAYSELLLYYLTEEMPKTGEILATDGVRRVNKLDEGSMLQVANVNIFLSSGDTGSRFLNALHAYTYNLAVNIAQLSASTSHPNDRPGFAEASSDGTAEGNDSPRRSQSISGRPRARKASMLRRLTQEPLSIPLPQAGWDHDLINLARILQVVQECLPIRGLLTGAPMLVHLHDRIENSGESDIVRRLRNLVNEVWKTIGRAWNCRELLEQQELDCPSALQLLVNCSHIQEALGMSKPEVRRRLSMVWSPKIALYGSTDKHFEASVRGDNISPLLKISPALMQTENISLQSLTKSTRGLGVSDLREALEGRNSMSNPTLAKPASISTYDYTSSMTGGDPMLRLSPTRSRSKIQRKGQTGNGDIRDVLTKLGIGKQNTNLLKAPFLDLHK